MEIGRSKQALFPEIRWICTKQRIYGVAKLWTYVVGACPLAAARICKPGLSSLCPCSAVGPLPPLARGGAESTTSLAIPCANCWASVRLVGIPR